MAKLSLGEIRNGHTALSDTAADGESARVLTVHTDTTLQAAVEPLEHGYYLGLGSKGLQVPQREVWSLVSKVALRSMKLM